MKCSECGSYNTVRDKGPLVRKPGTTDPSGAGDSSQAMSITPPLSPVGSEAAAGVVIPPASNEAASFTMTPDPSPMRLDTPSDRGTNISAIARRITFDDEEDITDTTEADITDPTDTTEADQT